MDERVVIGEGLASADAGTNADDTRSQPLGTGATTPEGAGIADRLSPPPPPFLSAVGATPGASSPVAWQPPAPPVAVRGVAGPPLRLWRPIDAGVVSFLFGFPAGLGLAARNGWRLGRRARAVAQLAAAVAGLMLIAISATTAVAAAINVVIVVYVYWQTVRDTAAAHEAQLTVQPAGVPSGLATILGAWAIVLALAIPASALILMATGQAGQTGSSGKAPAAATMSPGTPAASAAAAAPVASSAAAPQASEAPATPAASSPDPWASGAPHDDADLEAMLPEVVGGRQLTHESYRGRVMLQDLFGLSDSDVAAVADELTKQGLTIDDVSLAVDGRSQMSDPPYFVNALRFKGIPAVDLQTRLGLHPGTFNVDHPTADTFTTVTVGGKVVLKGTLAMVDQTSHARGIPYVYNSGDIQYVVVTDDPDWAADALRQLP